MKSLQGAHQPNSCSTPRPRIVIVGGGTAGWMSAATLRRRLGCEVTLVESPQTPAIGVGEATIPAMVDWIDNMGIDEEQLLRRCRGTYKLAIRFDNWVTTQHRYWHPFGVCGGNIDGHDLIHFWRRGVTEGWLDPESRYIDFSIQKQLCEHAKSLRPVGGPPVVSNYAFHLDAGLLAEFIKEIAIDDGVQHRIAHVVGARFDNAGSIQQIRLQDDQSIEADLFVDCSGFASVLIEKALGSPWTDWSDRLLCDRAVTMRIPARGDDQIESLPYTISTGQQAGWTWQIPLCDATGMGYVYSSKYIEDGEATHQLRQLGGLAEDPSPPNIVSFRVGYRPESWRANCVSIGLSSGFIEPLESTGIFLVQRALDELVDSLAQSDQPQSQQARFNSRMQSAYEEICDFVLLHYVLSERDDTPFWRHARNVTPTDSLARFINQYRQTGKVELPRQQDPVFAEANHHFILDGSHRSPTISTYRNQSSVYRYRAETIAPLLSSIRTTNEHLTAALPSHRQILNSIHQPTSCAC